jgi:CheY-like chemotaxis protein
MSGLNRPHVRQRALEAGAEAFLVKPVDPQRLLRVVTGREPAEVRSTPAVASASQDDNRAAC